MEEKITEMLAGVQKHAPDVLAQMTSYAVNTSLLWAVACLALVAGMVWLFFHDFGDSEGNAIAKVVACIIGLLFLGFACSHIDTFIHAKFYPKAYLARTLLGR
jgi:bacteriorhodopsin